MPSDVFIVGENITGLYLGIRSLEKGYTTTIVDKRFKVSSSKSPIIFTDNHFAFKKFTTKFGFQTEEIANPLANDHSLKQLIVKSEKLHSILQNSLTLFQFCQSTFGKNTTRSLFQHCILEKYAHSNVMFAIAMIKKNILQQRHYILKDNQSVVLEKLRHIFKEKGGIIIYRCNVFRINVISNLSFSTNTDKGIYKSNIVIVTLKSSNILRLYPWTTDKIEYIDSVQSADVLLPFLKTNTILERFNLAIPEIIQTDRSHTVFKEGVDPIHTYNNIKQIISPNIHFYIVNTHYSKNQGWINGVIDMANDIIRNF